MAPRIPPVGPDGGGDERTAELLRSLRFEPEGDDLHLFATLAHHPRLLKRWSAFGGTLLFNGELAARDRELLILRTAWCCGADYEWGHHVPLALEAGLTRQEVDATVLPVEEGAWDGWSAWDLTLLRAADELHEANEVCDATWAALAERLDQAQLLELCMLVGQYHLVAFTIRSAGIEREPGIEGFPFGLDPDQQG